MTTSPAPAGIDPRGPRFGAAVTSVVLIVVVLTGSVWLLAAQTLVFAAGALFGVTRSPYAFFYRSLVRPRLGPPSELEDPRPPRFAQLVGLVVAGLGLVLAVAGVSGAVVVFGALALVAAVLNAVFGLCLGCELYLLLVRLRSRPA
jgi:hypothetical protein